MTAKTIILGIADPDNNQTVSGVGRAVLDPDSIATVTFARDMDEDDLRAVTTGAVMLATVPSRRRRPEDRTLRPAPQLGAQRR